MEQINNQWVREQIMNLYADSRFQKLNAYYSKTTVFNILRAERNENRFSAFLCWLFNPEGSHGLHEMPLKKLLALYAYKKRTDTIGTALMTGNYSITEVKECTTEKVVKDITNGKETRRIDIWILIDAVIDSKSYAIPIVIENKVYSSENDSQTKAYHEAVNIFKQKEDSKEKTVLPVEIYLTPDDPKPCNCKEFVNITYQELLDNVIEPLVGMSEDAKSEMIITDFIKNLSVLALEEDVNSPGNAVKSKFNSILAVSKKERTELGSLYSDYKDLYCAALYVAGDDKARSLFPDMERPDAESEALLENLWNSNFSFFTTIMYVCRKEIAPGKENDLMNVFKESRRDNTKYLVKIKDSKGQWVVPAQYSKPMTKGKAVAAFFTLWLEIPIYDLEFIRKAFPSSLNNYYYGTPKDRWGDSVVWELIEGSDGENYVRAENGFEVKLSAATWDFYESFEIGRGKYSHTEPGNNRTGQVCIVKMWRKDDFQRLLDHINSHKEDYFINVEICEVKEVELQEQ